MSIFFSGAAWLAVYSMTCSHNRCSTSEFLADLPLLSSGNFDIDTSCFVVGAGKVRSDSNEGKPAGSLGET